MRPTFQFKPIKSFSWHCWGFLLPAVGGKVPGLMRRQSCSEMIHMIISPPSDIISKSLSTLPQQSRSRMIQIFFFCHNKENDTLECAATFFQSKALKGSPPSCPQRFACHRRILDAWWNKQLISKKLLWTFFGSGSSEEQWQTLPSRVFSRPLTSLKELQGPEFLDFGLYKRFWGARSHMCLWLLIYTLHKKIHFDVLFFFAK